jgi:hypothetical protein
VGERSGKDRIKVHIAVGVNTHIITAAAINDRDTNGRRLLPELIQKTEIKQKFGDNVRSRSDTAKVNEALTKLFCHNLSALS